MPSLEQNLADAYEAVAIANHYHVGIVGDVTPDLRDAARQILIRRENAAKWKTDKKRIGLALDLLENDDRAYFQRESRGDTDAKRKAGPQLFRALLALSQLCQRPRNETTNGEWSFHLEWAAVLIAHVTGDVSAADLREFFNKAEQAGHISEGMAKLLARDLD